MKKYVLLACIATSLLGNHSTVIAQLPAFPGAEGHGRYTTGGRGGKVVTVTNLEDTGVGSLRWALSQSGTKTIVFEVAGTIHLKSELKTGKDNLTIAGQTSPGGICIADYPFVINSNNVIVRFLRFRPGDTSRGEPDGLGGDSKKNIIIDHCSVSWSVDECLSVYGMQNSTVQWCIASEALRVSTHSKKAHCYGGNWGGNMASYHHNLIAHCESRTPRLGPKPATQQHEYVDIRNNVYYNWAGNGCYGGEGMQVNIVNNYYKPGPATDKASSKVKYRIASIGIRTTKYVAENPSFKPMEHIWGKYYIDGNVVEGNSAVSKDNWTKGVYEQISSEDNDNLFTSATKDTIRLQQSLEPGVVTTHSAEDAYRRVLDYAGCCLYRDAVDERIVADTRSRKATFTASGNKPGYINSQNDLKPSGATVAWSAWPELLLDENRDVKDTDGDGIPDWWEKAHGLSPDDYSDGNAKTLSRECYTNLEVYLNSLVEEIVSAQNKGGELDVESGQEIEGRPLLTVSDDTLSFVGLPQNSKINVYASTGAMLISSCEKGDIASFSLPRGIYIVRVTAGEHVYTYKVRIG